MTQEQVAGEEPNWLGTKPERDAVVAREDAFNEGKFWIGRHGVDQDTLVFDPSATDPCGERLALYSLTQHRMRTFPRSVVESQIEEVVDEVAREELRTQYEDRVRGREVMQEAEAALETERMQRQRDGVLDAHRRYLDAIGGEYRGADATPASHKSGRRTKCHACGIRLDDFAGTVCGTCNGVLCSCGACACERKKAE